MHSYEARGTPMNQLLQRPSREPPSCLRRNRTDSPASCWPSWNQSGNGLSSLPVPNRRACWNVWPTRLCPSTVQARLGLSPWKTYRCAFVYAAQLLGCVSAPSGPCAAASARILPPVCVGSQPPKLGFQTCESETSSVLSAGERRLSRSRRIGSRRHGLVLDRSAPRIRQASQANVALL